MSRSGLLATVVLVALGAHAQAPTCPGSGLSVVGGKLGDKWSLSLNGPPGALAVVATDASAGPVSTPLGTVCLGLTSALTTISATLDAAGTFTVSGTLPVAPTTFLPGTTVFTQAALAHPSLPGGYSLTNGAAVTFRMPRLALLRGNASPSFDLIDAVSNSVASSTPLAAGYQFGPALHVPRLGWFAWKTPTNSIWFGDDTLATIVLMIPGAWAPNPPVPGSMAVSDDGAYLFVSDIALLSTIAGTYLVTLKTYSLPSGALVSSPTFVITNSATFGLYPIPGTSLVYAFFQNEFHVVDGATGSIVSTIVLPGSPTGYYEHFAFVSPGRIWVVIAGALYGVDTAAHAIVAGPVPLGAAAIPLAIGPSASGPALWAGVTTPSSANSLVAVSLQTLAVQSVAPLASLPYAPSATASAGETTMLIVPLVSPAAGMLSEVHATTWAVTPVLSGVAGVTALRSDTLRRAYAYTSLGLVSFPTDPFPGGGTIIPLANPGATVFRLISN